MKLVASLALLATAAASLHAQAPQPGSVLVFPSIRSTPFATTFISVSNTSLSPLVPAPGVQNPPDVLAYYNYVNAVQDPNDVYRPLACNHFCRAELLTPADHITVSSMCHNPGENVGYLVVSAHGALGGGRISHNYLVGSAAIFDYRAGGVYVYNAIPFCSPLTRGESTDIHPADGRLDFDGFEYEKMHDHLIVDSFISAFNSRLALADFSCLPGDHAEVTVDLSIWNDNERALSLRFPFVCWFEEELHDISVLFTNGWLMGVPNDPEEIDIHCDNIGDFEAGWFLVTAAEARIDTQTESRPPLLGVLLGGPRSCSDSRIIWGSKLRKDGCF